MITIRGDNVNDLFINLANTLLKSGAIRSPRGLKTLELEDAWLELDNPSESIVTLPAREIDLEYLSGELEWYKSGDLRVESIAKHSKFWTKLQDSNGTINSNYGFLALIEKHAGKSQYEWCLSKLREDSETRQAVINYNQPRHKYSENKDFVCTLSQLFRIKDGKLDSVVMMRSNDMIFGLTYDLPWFTYLQSKLASDLGIPIGKYKHYAASLHVYEKHFTMLENIARSKNE